MGHSLVDQFKSWTFTSILNIQNDFTKLNFTCSSLSSWWRWGARRAWRPAAQGAGPSKYR